MPGSWPPSDSPTPTVRCDRGCPGSSLTWCARDGAAAVKVKGIRYSFPGSSYAAVDMQGVNMDGSLDLDLMTRILANLPHLAIGGFAAYTGFVLSKRHGETA